jgi:sugar lactone lactonase YvrE
MSGFTTLIEGLTFTECPRWREGRLYFSDFYTHRVLAVGMDGAVETLATVPGIPAGLGFLPDGALLIASKRDRRIWRRAGDGLLTVYADLSGMAGGYLNDMLVDARGRVWAGNYGFDLDGGEAMRRTQLIRVEPDGAMKLTGGEVVFPNGMVLTPDGGTLIVAETMAGRLSAFEVTEDGLGERRSWGEFGGVPETTDAMDAMEQVAVAPDGICLDAGGAVWVADVMHARVLRVAEGGRVLEERGTNGLRAVACMLGGEDGRRLFVCVAAELGEAEAVAKPMGAVLMTRVEVGHAGTP